MKRLRFPLAVAALGTGLLLAACSQAAPAPTQAPAKPAATEPTKAPAAAPVSTSAPGAAAASTSAPAASKVDWPTKGKSVQVVIPYSAGGATDVGARMLLPYFEKDFGISFPAENNAGAGSQLGLTAIANAKPDGYTIGCGNFPAMITTYLDPARKAVYSRKSFEPLGLAAIDPVAVAVRQESPFKSVKDIVDAAKANPKKVRIGTSTLTGAGNMAIIEFQQVSGIQVAVVGFDGGATLLPAILGGQMDAAFSYTSEMAAQVQSGEVRILGIADSEPSKFAPGVQTLAAQGYNVAWGSSRSMLAPAGTPKEIVNLYTGSMKKALEGDDLKGKLEKQFISVRYMAPDQLGSYWDQQEAKTKPMMELLLQAAAPAK